MKYKNMKMPKYSNNNKYNILIGDYMPKKKTSFFLDADLLKDLKFKAVELGTSQTVLIEKFIKQGLINLKEIHNFIKDDSGAIFIENLNPNLLKKISEMAKDKKITEDETMIELLERGIENKTKNKIPEHLIANKDTYNPNPTKEELNSIVGIIEAPEGFDVVEAVNDVRVRKWE